MAPLISGNPDKAILLRILFVAASFPCAFKQVPKLRMEPEQRPEKITLPAEGPFWGVIGYIGSFSGYIWLLH